MTTLSAATGAAQAAPAPVSALDRALAGDRLQKALARSPHYAGVRGSADGVGLDVYLTDPGNGADHAVARRAAGTVPVHFAGAGRTWASLLATEERIAKDGPALRDYGLRFVRPSVLRNRLEVGLAHPTAAAQATLRARYGDGVVAVAGGAGYARDTASRLNDSSPWNGGDFIAFDNGEDCTSGPAVQNASGHRYLLTAGHCFFKYPDLNPHAWNGSFGYRVFQGAHLLGGDAQPYIGNAAAERGYGYDSALVDAPASGLDWRTANANDQGTAWAQKGEFASTEATTGLCVSGAYSGERCGVAVDYIELVRSFGPDSNAYVSHLVEATNVYGLDVAGPGDSGAPVYAVGSTGVYVTGVQLAVPNGTMPCTRNNIVGSTRYNHCGATFWYSNLSSVMNHRGVTLYIR